jgi:hypothetical protein
LSALTNSQAGESLAERVTQRDTTAILQAAEEGRTDLIPLLESVAARHDFSPGSPETAARKALARLGSRTYVDLFIRDLTHTTNSEAYTYWTVTRGFEPMKAEYTTKIEALKNLAYIRSRFAVRAIASTLNDTNRPLSSAHVVRDTPASMAAWTLSQMNLENAPAVDQVRFPQTEADQQALRHWLEGHPGQQPFASPKERIAAWQQWWEQNKDKYP